MLVPVTPELVEALSAVREQVDSFNEQASQSTHADYVYLADGLDQLITCILRESAVSVLTAPRGTARFEWNNTTNVRRVVEDAIRYLGNEATPLIADSGLWATLGITHNNTLCSHMFLVYTAVVAAVVDQVQVELGSLGSLDTDGMLSLAESVARALDAA